MTLLNFVLDSHAKTIAECSEFLWSLFLHNNINISGMGESNCAWSRPLLLRREALAAATKLYQEMYGSDDSIPATIQLLYFIGWKSHPSQVH